MNLDLADIGINAIRQITDVWRAGRSESLIDYTRTLRVEPIALIDSDVMFYEGMPDIMQSLQSIFSGYYLQAVALSTTVGRINVQQHLGKFNPNRDLGEATAYGLGKAAGSDSVSGWLLASENYSDSLPFYKSPEAIALEADKPQKPIDINSGKVVADAASEMRELANLSVGKMLTVEITDGNHKAAIPVAIRLIASSIPSRSIVHILSVGKEDTSMKERYYAWKAGRLKFMRDLVFCQDLIDAHRKNLMEDADGLYGSILSRKRNNQMAAIMTGQPSVATASNMAVISSETAEDLEAAVCGELKSFKVREALFKETSLMILVVVEKQWDRVKIYHRGIAEVTSISIRDMKTANKGNGPDVSEILKAYQLGSAPSL